MKIKKKWTKYRNVKLIKDNNVSNNNRYSIIIIKIPRFEMSLYNV
jgi:hypothetical protein